MSPSFALGVLWDLWIVSWFVAAFWSRRTAARPSFMDEAMHLTPTLIGGALLFWGSSAWFETLTRIGPQKPLWVTPDPIGWVLFTGAAAGLAFTWWARITLGSLWSGSVARKEGQAVVRAGPYRLVRHPIYTGLIFAAFCTPLLDGQQANLLGAVLFSFGFWLKARLEERFLGAQLGAAAYADYRSTTPMLIPFWPTARRPT
jgi:protein-S-isoprenylcysteine O-methyltransferase Ste14